MRKNILLLFSILITGSLILTSCGDDDDDDDMMQDTSTLYVETDFTTECGGSEQTFTEVTVNDRGEGTGTMTWTNDKTYILDGFVFVNEGQTLTIEEGTVIKGNSGQGENASALIVARGAKIEAEGTADNPIVFTTEADKVYSNENGLCDGSTFSDSPKGIWGGVIILGNSTITKATEEAAIEGIPTSEPRGLYGGTDEADNSGTFRYVSIRHGGSNIGAGNEINGLTMGGVGSGTTIDHVEVYANQDDGFEWFGGTVNTSYLVSAYCGDDAMDYDQGWRGNNQYWFVYQINDGDHGGEHDGGDSDCEGCEPYATPIISNATFVGADEKTDVITFRDNAGGMYFNSIFMNYNNGVDIEYLDSQDDSYNQFVLGNLRFENNIMMNVAENLFVINNTTSQDLSTEQAEVEAYFNDNNMVGDPSLDGIVPMAGGAADEAGTSLSQDNSFFTDESYKGAFETGQEPWFKGWTKLGQSF